ncbi:probable elongation factor 1-beta [Exaiptasia diaphana]|uniref:Elongation factor 1-delta n=1 Tax=Exaiptasia diaphana TaxID=2652724 RepID=A0A913WZJ5_EXADI|nr:probable elongation factor 1-beta [Exaiptasia diaphana]
MGSECMQYESIWFDRHVFDEAEELNQMYLNGLPLPVQDGHHHHGHHHDHGKHHGKQHHDHHDKQHHEHKQHHGKHQDHHHGKQHHDHHKQHHGKGSSTSVMEIAEARRKIQQTLSGAPPGASSHSVNEKRLDQLEADNKELRQQNKELVEAMKKLELRVAQLESSKTTAQAPAPTPPPKEAKKEVKKEDKDEDDDDSDDDMFGSDSEEEDSAEQERIKQERLAAYYAKKAAKPKVIAKSSITIDVKPWDDETDVKEMEKLVRSITADGLVWGAAKILPIAYGIMKLQIACVVEDDKIGTDFLEESIGAFEDHVQSVDVVSFNKL